MPYIDNLDDDEQLQNGEASQVSSGSQVLGSGSGAPTAQNAQANAKKGSGQFADLGEYLRVNAPQQFGSKLAGKVGDDVAQAGETVQKAGDEFKNRADQSTVVADADLVSRATGEGAADFAADDNNVTAFQNQMNAEYKGPTAFSDARDLYSQATSAAKTAASKAKAGDSEGGRFALLDNYFGRDNYTTGEKSLDNMLVQNDPNSQQAFKQMQENAKAVADQSKQVEAQANTFGSQARGTTEGTKRAAREAIGIDDAGNIVEGSGAIGGLQSTVNQSLEQRMAKQQAEREAISAALQNRDLTTLTPEQRQLLSLEDVRDLYGLDASKYLSATELSRGGVATVDQQRRMAALAKLANLENSFLPDADLAGTQDDEALLAFDRAGLGAAIDSADQFRKASRQNELSQPVDNKSFTGSHYFDLESLPGLRLQGKSLSERDAILFDLIKNQAVPQNDPSGRPNPLYAAIVAELHANQQAYKAVADKYATKDPLKK